jgi:uncharacterized repeat protein (TIGR01451 family)
MNMKFTEKISKIWQAVPKRLAVTFGVLSVVMVSAVALAWGPERPTFTKQNPASYVTFNSITNSDYGDERNFVLAKATGEASNTWRDSIDVQPDQTYTVRMLVHNNAAANLGLKAENTTVRVSVPNKATNNSIRVDGFVSASNSNPATVWDQVTFNSDRDFQMAYVAGSARYYNNVNPSSGFSIPDSVISSAGALVGYESMNGVVQGCYEYSGILSVTLRAIVSQPPQTPDFTVEKQVRKHGDSTWSKNITAKPGEKVDYLISYKNTGNATTKNGVVVSDRLPAGVSYIMNSTYLRNGLYNTGSGTLLTDNTVTTSGVNIGNYTAGAAAYTSFTATLPSEQQLVCGANRLVNTGYVTADNTTKSDTATVTVNRDCPEPEKEFICDRLKVAKLGRTDFQFVTDYTVKNTTYQNITYVISGNGVYETKVSTDTVGRLNYSQTKPGTYKVKATLNTAAGSNSSVSCEQEITVEPEPAPSEAICKVLNANPTTIKAGESVNFTVVPEYRGQVTLNSAWIDFGDGVQTSPIDVLNFSHRYAAVGTYKAKAYLNYTVDGQAVNNVTSVACEKTIKVEVPPPQPEYVCERLNINQVGRTDFQFTTDYRVVNTDYRSITYVISGNNIYEARVSAAADGALSYSQTKPGTYKVKATLNTAAGNSSSVACEGEITVSPEPEPSEAVCKALTASRIGIKPGDGVSFRVFPEYKGNVSVVGSWMNFGDGVRTTSQDVYNYTHIYNREGKYTAIAYVDFIVDGQAVDNVTSVECEVPVTVTSEPVPCPIPGKEHLPIDDPGCKEDRCTVPGKEYLPPNDPDCKTDGGGSYTYVPGELPRTGAGLAGIVGLGSVATAAGYYIASRRQLRQS